MAECKECAELRASGDMVPCYPCQIAQGITPAMTIGDPPFVQVSLSEYRRLLAKAGEASALLPDRHAFYRDVARRGCAIVFGESEEAT